MIREILDFKERLKSSFKVLEEPGPDAVVHEKPVSCVADSGGRSPGWEKDSILGTAIMIIQNQ